MLLFSHFSPLYSEKFLCFFLVAGMIFPGIPHGALDNHLLKKPLNNGTQKTLFYLFYLGLMATIILIWAWAPWLGLVVFLAFSAWHFGQTDNLAIGITNSGLHFVNGSLILSSILLSNSQETLYYLGLLHISIPNNLPVFNEGIGAVILGIYSLILFRFAKSSLYTVILYILILILCGMLPLIAGFGLYFIGIHSLNGWTSIQLGLKKSHLQLLKKSGLFSVLAYIFILLFLWIYGGNISNNHQYTAWFFVALASLSIPHIVLMHFFYKQNGAY